MEKLDLPFLNFCHIEQNINDIFEFAKEELNLKLKNNQSLKSIYFESINKIQITEVPYNEKKINITYYDKNLQDKLLELKMIDEEDLKEDNHIYTPEEQKKHYR